MKKNYIVFALCLVFSWAFSQEYEIKQEILYLELEPYLWSPRYIVQTPSGVAFATMGKDQRVWMVKLDNDLRVEWSRQVYAGTGQTAPDKLFWSESDTCYYLGGSGLWDNRWRGFFVKLDSLGNVIKDTLLFLGKDESFLTDFIVSEHYCPVKIGPIAGQGFWLV